MSYDFTDSIFHSLIGYCIWRWPGYATPKHLVKIANALERVESGHCKRLIIEAPPRMGKSVTTSELFPAWYLGRNPSKKVMFFTMAQQHANRFGRKVRNQIQDPEFKALFNVGLAKDSKSASTFVTSAGGEYHCFGINGQATGKGADLIIFDDTLKGRKAANSIKTRDTIKEMYSSTAYSRLEPNGALIIMQARWSDEDLIGYVTSEFPDEKWERITYTAMNPEETETLWPERYSIERMKMIKQVMGIYDWASLYMQSPMPMEGGIFPPSVWQFYDHPPKHFDRIVQSWDMSFKKTDTSSFVVGQVWGKLGPRSFLLHQFRKQCGFSETLKALVSVSDLYPKAFKKLIEDKANGPGIIDVLQDKMFGIEAVEVQGSKEARAHAVSDITNSKVIYLPNPKNNPWVLEFIKEHANFTGASGEVNDQVDATTQALDDLYGKKQDRIKNLLTM